jgi:DNA-binding MarR family transcriptional regulator
MSTAGGRLAAWQDQHVADLQPEPGSPRQELVNAAGLAARLHQNAYDRFEDAAADYFGVNRTAMRCMDVLERVGRLTPGEIATETGLTSGAVTALLDRLERVGYVRRVRDAADRRRIWVELTDKARQATADVYGPLVETMAEHEKYSDAELRLITRYIERGSELLLAHAARIEEMRGRRDRRDRRDRQGQLRRASWP